MEADDDASRNRWLLYSVSRRRPSTPSASGPPARPPKSRVHPALQWSTLSSSSTEAAGEAAAGGAVWSVAPSPRQSWSAGR